MSNGLPPDPDDFFAETRMRFGDHIEELRGHLWRAFIGLGFALFIGFIFDAIGYYSGLKIFGLPFGIGRPMMDIIQQPVNNALEAFYKEREEEAVKEAKTEGTDAALAMEPKPVTMLVPPEALAEIRGQPIHKVPKEGIEVEVMVAPKDLYKATQKLDRIVHPTVLSTLSVQEGLMVYF